jgi:hypothetical protein
MDGINGELASNRRTIFSADRTSLRAVALTVSTADSDVDCIHIGGAKREGARRGRAGATECPFAGYTNAVTSVKKIKPYND